MPLPVYDTQDLVPADQRDDYVEHEGKWHPKVVVDLETERQKRTALLDEKKKEKERREAAERERDELKRTKEAADSGVTEAALKKIRDDEAAARKPIEDENKILRDENRKLKLTDRVRALYLSDKVGGMADRADDAMDLLFKKDHERVDLGDADGLMFKDEKGQVTADDAETFFKKFRAVKPWLFKGSGASGSGAEGSNGSGAGDASDAEVAKRVAVQKQAMVRGAF
jgi:hypothetical protein